MNMAAFKRCIVFAWIAVSAAVLITSIVSACLARFKEFDGHTFLLGSGDQRPIRSQLFGESFSSYYCRGLNISVASGSGEGTIFSVYALPLAPVPSGASYRQVVKRTTTIGSNGASPPFAFTLHRAPGSVGWMKVHACSATTTLTLYRCQDESAAVAWEEEGDSQGCTVMCQYSRCGTAKKNYCSFVADSPYQVDEFVFVLAALEGPPSDNKAYVDVNLTRFPYNLREHSAACLNVTQCDLPVVMAETKAVVLEIPPTVTANSITLQTECEARIGIYFAFFLGFPLAVILVASLLVFLPCLLLHKTMRKQSIELQVKGASRGATTGGPPSERDGAGLLPNEHLNEN